VPSIVVNILDKYHKNSLCASFFGEILHNAC
jgi:hypothetical protein